MADILQVALVNGSAANVGKTIQGQFGSLLLKADGSYQYTLNNSLNSVQSLAQGQIVKDTFSYQNTDNKGGTSTANLVIFNHRY